MENISVLLLENVLQYITHNRLRIQALKELARASKVMCQKSRVLLWHEMYVAGRISEADLLTHPCWQFVETLSIWGSSKIVLKTKIFVENDAPNKKEASDNIVGEVDLNNYAMICMDKLRELFPKITAIHFMLVKQPALLLDYLRQHWLSVCNVNIACHINNSAIASSSRLPEMASIISEYSNVLKRLKLEYWYSDKDFMLALFQSQTQLSSLGVDVYADSFDECTNISHAALTSLDLQYVRWIDNQQILNITSKLFPSLQKAQTTVFGKGCPHANAFKFNAL